MNWYIAWFIVYHPGKHASLLVLQIMASHLEQLQNSRQNAEDGKAETPPFNPEVTPSLSDSQAQMKRGNCCIGGAASQLSSADQRMSKSILHAMHWPQCC